MTNGQINAAVAKVIGVKSGKFLTSTRDLNKVKAWLSNYQWSVEHYPDKKETPPLVPGNYECNIWYKPHTATGEYGYTEAQAICLTLLVAFACTKSVQNHIDKLYEKLGESK